MQRFFVSPEHIDGEQVIFSDEQAHQMAKVLRLAPGDTVKVLDNSGTAFTVNLTAVERRHAAGHIIGQETVNTEPEIAVTVCQGLIKRGNFEWMLQKCTEVGAAGFLPVQTSRTVVTVKDSKLDRWESIITEAAEQSGRGRLPELYPPAPLDAALNLDFDLKLIPWVGEEACSIRDVVAEVADKPIQSVGLFIGPEGGFSDDEIAQARAAGALPVTLGPRILRAETAAVVALALLLDIWTAH